MNFAKDSLNRFFKAVWSKFSKYLINTSYGVYGAILVRILVCVALIKVFHETAS